MVLFRWERDGAGEALQRVQGSPTLRSHGSAVPWKKKGREGGFLLFFLGTQCNDCGQRFEWTGIRTTIQPIREMAFDRVIEYYTVSKRNRNMQHTPLKQITEKWKRRNEIKIRSEDTAVLTLRVRAPNERPNNAIGNRSLYERVGK